MRTGTLGIIGMAATALVACSSEQEMTSPAAGETQESASMQKVAGPAASASLEPTQGNNVAGLIEFHATDDGVRVKGSLSGLTPGPHGFHVHEKGDCSAPDGSSAGGHYNPGGHEHAGPDADTQHMGDMGNIEAGDDGKATFDARYEFMVLEPGADNSILGKAIIVHQGSDDLSSQPSGSAGPRVACGVISPN